MSEKMLVSIYRSSRKEGMYLFVARGSDLKQLPEVLLKQFGLPQPSMDLVLEPQRKLARAEASEVIRLIAEQGFYLQMPPTDVEPPLSPRQTDA